ncbi:MAG: uracil phosphoribosyltransferase [Thermodesulfobacteriota bacterium]|nr:uracil phosphoribosyltransferase [Thermodesulfobacteriota bacterium]
MSNLVILKNPVIRQIGLSLHDVETESHLYRENTRKLGEYMGLELASMDILPTKSTTVKTPLGSLREEVVDDDNIGIVNVLRAGTPMAMGMGEVFPKSHIAFVSAWRREEGGQMVADTDYNRGIESLKDRFVILTDPALASGASLLATLDVISEYVDPKRCVICCLHVAKEGVENIFKEYPDIKIFTLFGPSEVNEHCYIVNGPGDCGDRCFNID